MIGKNDKHFDDTIDDPLFRRVSKKEIVFTIAAFVYLLAAYTIYDIYSAPLGLGMLLLAILSLLGYFLRMPKEKRATAILRDLSRTPTDEIIFHLKNLLGFSCMLAILIGFLLGIFLTGHSPQLNDIITIVGSLTFFALLLVGIYWLLTKRILPLLMERSGQSPRNSSGVTMDRNT